MSCCISPSFREGASGGLKSPVARGGPQAARRDRRVLLRPQPFVADAQLGITGVGAPPGSRGGRIGRRFGATWPVGAVLAAQMVLIVSKDGETALAAICFAVA